MEILILNWRDIKNPASGGAEIYTHEVAKRLVQRGHRITLFCASFPGAKSEEMIDGVKIIRKGRQWTVHWHAYRWYRKRQIPNSKSQITNHKLQITNYQPHFDLVIDEINTIPFFTPLYIKKTKIFALIHQLCRQIWWYEVRFPLNVIGYLLEPLYLKIYKNIPTITVSQSTKKDLLKLGFKKVFIIENGLNVKPVKKFPSKTKNPTIIYVGRMKKAKKPQDAIRAFEIVKKKIKNAQLWMVGEGYLRRKLKKACAGIKVFGYLDERIKNKLVKKAWVIVVPGTREGWGQVVTDAAALGTPAIAYNISGLKDSVRHNKTGIMCKENNPECLSKEVIRLINDKKKYQKLQYNAWRWSKEFSWYKTAKEFIKIINF